jgi:hypothetical protein
VSTIDALSDVIKAVGNNPQIDVYVDGGIRRGTDILKAVALGAKAVLIGRPILWGLAVDGEQGVRNVLEILKNEFNLLSFVNDNYRMPTYFIIDFIVQITNTIFLFFSINCISTKLGIFSVRI